MVAKDTALLDIRSRYESLLLPNSFKEYLLCSIFSDENKKTKQNISYLLLPKKIKCKGDQRSKGNKTENEENEVLMYMTVKAQFLRQSTKKQNRQHQSATKEMKAVSPQITSKFIV